MTETQVVAVAGALVAAAVLAYPFVLAVVFRRADRDHEKGPKGQ